MQVGQGFAYPQAVERAFGDHVDKPEKRKKAMEGENKNAIHEREMRFFLAIFSKVCDNNRCEAAR